MTGDVPAALYLMATSPTRQGAVKWARTAYERGATHDQLEAAWREWSEAQDRMVQRIYTDRSQMCRCAHALHDGRRCPRSSCGCRESRAQKAAS